MDEVAREWFRGLTQLNEGMATEMTGNASKKHREKQPERDLGL